MPSSIPTQTTLYFILRLGRSFYQYLFSFSISTVRNQCKICGLKQHKCITIQFWRSDILNVPHVCKTKVSSELHLFLEALGGSPFSDLFQLLEVALDLWVGLPLHLESQQGLLKSLSPHYSDTDSPASLFHLLGTLVITLYPPR